MGNCFKLWGIGVVAMLAFLACAIPAQAQPVAGGVDTFDMAIDVNGRKEVVTVTRDLYRPAQWYYVPSKPHVCMTDNGEPVFALLKIQAKDPITEKPINSAFIQFAVTLGLPPASVEEMRQKLEKVMDPALPRPVMLAPLPIESAKISIMHPKTGALIAAGGEAPELTTANVNAEIPMQLYVTSLGADVYEDLVSGNTGIPVWFEFSYNMISIPASIKVRANWKTVHEHVSSDVKLKADIAYEQYGLAPQVNHARVREFLTSKKGIFVETISGEAWPADKIEKVEGQILDQLFKEVFEADKTFIDKIDPAAAKDPEMPTGHLATPKQQNPKGSETVDIGDTVSKVGDGLVNTAGKGVMAVLSGGATCFMQGVNFKAGVSVAMKDIKKVRSGDVEIIMNKRTIVKKTSGCGTFIGIGNFIKKNPALKDKLIRTLNQGNWEVAEFHLPPAPTPKSTMIQQMNITVSILDGSGAVAGMEGQARTVTFKNDGGDKGKWVSTAGNELSVMEFPFAAIMKRARETKEVNKLAYKVETKIHIKAPNGNIKEIAQVQKVPVFSDVGAIASPHPIVANTKFSGDSIAYLLESGDLTSVIITLTDGKMSQTGQLTKADKDKPELEFTMAAPPEGTKLTAKIMFNRKGKKPLEVKQEIESEIIPLLMPDDPDAEKGKGSGSGSASGS